MVPDPVAERRPGRSRCRSVRASGLGYRVWDDVHRSGVTHRPSTESLEVGTVVARSAIARVEVRERGAPEAERRLEKEGGVDAASSPMLRVDPGHARRQRPLPVRFKLTSRARLLAHRQRLPRPGPRHRHPRRRDRQHGGGRDHRVPVVDVQRHSDRGGLGGARPLPRLVRFHHRVDRVPRRRLVGGRHPRHHDLHRASRRGVSRVLLRRLRAPGGGRLDR